VSCRVCRAPPPAPSGPQVFSTAADNQTQVRTAVWCSAPSARCAAHARPCGWVRPLLDAGLCPVLDATYQDAHTRCVAVLSVTMFLNSNCSLLLRRQVGIKVFQGEREMAADNKLLGQFDLVGGWRLVGGGWDGWRPLGERVAATPGTGHDGHCAAGTPASALPLPALEACARDVTVGGWRLAVVLPRGRWACRPRPVACRKSRCAPACRAPSAHSNALP
jgi:hypothetical protein